MITKITDSNRSKYSLLFEKANSDLFNSDGYTIEFEAVGPSEDFILGKTYYVVDEENGTYQNEDGDHFRAIEDLTAFADNETYYKAPAPAIYDLNTFFQNLQTLYGIDKNYMRLPLDEPCFEILDSSTDGRRVIQVPDDFANNGISVVGDEMAETIFFKTNRYYENIDLIGPTSAEVQQNSTLRPINIAIQWEKDGVKNVDKAIVDHTGIPFLDADNNIYFGWAIDSELTKKEGEIKFSVIFYQMGDNGNKVGFSLNTQTATVKVNSGLAYEIAADNQFKIDEETVVAHDNSLKITGRIRNSTTKYDSDQAEFSLAPSFTATGAIDIAALTADNTENSYRQTTDTALVTGKTYYEAVSGGGYTAVTSPVVADIEDYYEKTVYCKMDLETDNKIVRQGAAVAENGSINYIWKSKANLTDSDSATALGTLGLNSDYSSLFKRVDSASTGPVSGIKYYKYQDGKYVQVTDLPDTTWRTADTDDDGCIYYEKRSPIATISGPGCYWLIATNNEGVKLPTSTDSTRIYVPGPTKVSSVSITNGNKYYDVNETISSFPLKPVFDKVTGDTLTYEWIDGQNNTVTTEEYSFASTTITDGFKNTYRFRVASERNNSEKVYSDPITVFISAKPQAFGYSEADKVTIDKKDNSTNLLYTADDLDEVTVTMPQPSTATQEIASDYILYNWYQAVIDAGGIIDRDNDIALATYTEEEKENAYEITDLSTTVIPADKLADEDTIYKYGNGYFKAVQPTTDIKTDSITFPEDVTLGFNTYYCDVINVFNQATSALSHTPYVTIKQSV